MAKRGIPVKPQSHRLIWRRGLVLAAFTMLSGVCMTRLAMRDWVPTGQPVRLSRLSDAELAPHLRALIRQGPSQLARVVAALSDQRVALRSAADRALHEEIDRCAQQPSDEAAWQLDEIARQLAAHAPQLDGDASALAAALAERILAISTRSGNNSDRLLHCHIVLKEGAERRMQEQARSPDGKFKSVSDSHDRAAGTGSASQTGAVVTLAPLAGGGLDVAPSDTQPKQLPPLAWYQAKPLSIRDAKREVAASTSGSNSPSRVQASAGSVSQASEVITAEGRLANPAAAGQHNLQTAIATAAQSASANPAMPPMPRDLARLLELAERVRFGSIPQSAATKAELLWLGIDELQLKLARGAIDDDPRVRREVAEALAHVASVDARDWLLWLSHDRDAEVRRAAISLLATASDPELKKRVRQAADGDADPRVRELARTALRETRP